MDSLNEYSLLHILDYLSPLDLIAVSKVNKYFEQLVIRTLRNYQKLVVKDEWKMYNFCIIGEEDTLSLIKLAGSHIKKLYINTFESPRYDYCLLYLGNVWYRLSREVKMCNIFDCICQFCDEVNYLSMDLSFLYDGTNVLNLLSSLKNIKTLHTIKSFERLERYGGIDILPNCLEEIRMSLDAPHPGILSQILKRYPTIRAVRIVGEVLILKENLIETILRDANQLKVLELFQNQDREPYNVIPEISINDIIPALVHLEEFSISEGCIHLKDTDLIKIASHCVNLKVLKLGIINISGEGLARALCYLEELEVLGIKIIPKSKVFEFIVYKELTNLKYLYLISSIYKNIQNVLGAIEKMPNLTFINTWDTDYRPSLRRRRTEIIDLKAYRRFRRIFSKAFTPWIFRYVISFTDKNSLPLLNSFLRVHAN